MASEIASKSCKHKAVVKELRGKIKAKSYKFKHLNQAITRRDKKIFQLQNKLKEQHLKLQLRKHQSKNFCLKKELVLVRILFSHLETILRKQLADKNGEILILQNDMIMLQEEVEQMQQTEQKTRNDKAYSADIRVLIYDMLVCQVPTHSVLSLLHKIGKHTGYRFSDIPHRTTVEQMVRELGVISDLQAAEIAFSTKSLTLGFDEKNINIQTIIHGSINKL